MDPLYVLHSYRTLAIDARMECSIPKLGCKAQICKNSKKSSTEHLKLEIECFVFYNEECLKKLNGGSLHYHRIL